MCGITGFWAPESPSYDPDSTLRRMTDALKNRGPDSSGLWWHDGPCTGLGHRRLSIIDLSEEGAQPMRSASGRYTLTYNGEIFNYLAIRRELDPVAWRGHSDTEVMLEAFERWGIEASVRRFNGQFAFAVWDDEAGTMTLVRDRVGIKPLYYGWFEGTFVFGSELDAIREHPRFVARPEGTSVQALLEIGYIPAPLSVYRNVYKLHPGTMLTLHHPAEEPPPRTYWSMHDVVRCSEPRRLDPEDAADRLDALLRDAVELRLVADVPVGAFLSGGIDSSLVCGIMQSVASGAVQTYAIGFEEASFDEAPFARDIARHLGTKHTELYVSSDEAMKVLPDLPALYDEPFADSSQIPTFLVSKLARQEVTVSLSGDGGDELFGGYNRYQRILNRWPRISWMPGPLRGVAAGVSTTASQLERTELGQSIAARLPRGLNRHIGFGQMGRFFRMLGSRNVSEFYRRSMALDASVFAGPVLADALRRAPSIDVKVPSGLGTLSTMTFVDLVSYLPDDILVKVDRASMAVSLEARVPLLDYRVVEFSWSLDSELKIRNGERKWLLKHLLERYVPRSMTDRPKSGFAVPVGDWLRGPLREWAESLLEERALNSQGMFDPSAVHSIWRQHASGKAEVPDLLWRILMYQAWASDERTPVTTPRDKATAA